MNSYTWVGSCVPDDLPATAHIIATRWADWEKRKGGAGYHNTGCVSTDPCGLLDSSISRRAARRAFAQLEKRGLIQ